MVRKLTLILVMFIVVSGCAPYRSLRQNATLSPATPGESNPNMYATSTSALPTVVSPKETPKPATSPQSGWKTYINTQLLVAVDYPSNWSVHEQSVGVAFTSPQGAEILLARVETGGLSPQDYLSEAQLPNTRCTMSTNAHNIDARICFDTIANSYTAYLILKPASGAERLLSLTTRSRESQVLSTMVASVRSAPVP